MTETNSGKTVLVAKVFDSDCDVCKHMEKIDRPVFDGFSEIGFQEVALDDVINHNNNLTKLRIYQCLEKHAVNPDYTIDLPVYVFLTKKGEFKGCHVGVATVVELRNKIKEILEDNPPSE